MLSPGLACIVRTAARIGVVNFGATRPAQTTRRVGTVGVRAANPRTGMRIAYCVRRVIVVGDQPKNWRRGRPTQELACVLCAMCDCSGRPIQELAKGGQPKNWHSLACLACIEPTLLVKPQV